jgi:hypothetical protein
LWYLLVNGAFFGGMMYYYLYSSCHLSNQLVDLSVSGYRSFYRDSFNSNGNYLCASYTTKHWNSYNYPYFSTSLNESIYYVSVDAFNKPCQLMETSCSQDYGRWNPKQCKDNRGCDETFSCENALQTENAYYSSSSVSIYYLTCYSASTAVANAFSYCAMAQIFVIGCYLLTRRILKYGVKDTTNSILTSIARLAESNDHENVKAA